MLDGPGELLAVGSRDQRKARQPDVSEVPASTFNEECLELDAAKARLQLSLRAADHAL